MNINDKAPNFTLTSHEDKTVSLSGYDKNVILFFVRTTNCYECRQHVEHLARLYPQIQEKNAEVLVIVHADEATVKQYAASVRAPFPVLADPTHQVYEEYGLNRVWLFSTRSGSLIVDKDGTVRYAKNSIVPFQWVKESDEVMAALTTLS
jgi:peroxiredoxin Q/BCP